MGEKAIKGKAISKVLSCLVVFAILMSAMPFSVFAVNDSINSTGNTSNYSNETLLEKAFTENNSAEAIIPLFNNNTTGKYQVATWTKDDSSGGDCAPIPEANMPEIYLNDTNATILPEVSNDTDKNVSALGCNVYVKIDDDTCVGYEVYVDGVYKLTEGEGGTPDGYCAFYVTAGTHTIEIRKNGCSASITHNFLCGHTYRWISMPDYWCECDDQCDNPPTVSFDKSKYYEGDTVHATVSTIHSSVHYEIKDCSGTIRESGYTSNGDSIYYTIPTGASECCYWEICFYWDEGTPPLGPLGTDGEVTTESYQCSKCYSFYVCPEPTCEVYVKIDDDTCVGYDVYVDGVYKLTEGEGGTPDGYCAFYVSPGTHKFEIRKNGCSASKSWDCQCGTVYRWISMPDYWCNCNKPDLVVQDIWWSPTNPKEGDTVTFSVKTKNQGSGNAGGFYVCYYVDGSYYDRDYVSSLSAGSTTTTSFSWTADCGSHSIKAVADCYSDVAESNEGNNARTEYINIVCKPDLITQDIYWSPSNPKEGDTVTFSVKTKNIGSGKTGGFYVCYYVDGSYYARDYVSSLSAGSTTTTSFSWTAKCGRHSIKAVADCYDAVTESNEGNNARTENINIVCKPDLVVQDISWSPSNPKMGDTVKFTATVKNVGKGAAKESFTSFYLLQGYTTLFSCQPSCPSLDPGETYTHVRYATLKECGEYKITAVADYSDAVEESNEENNYKTESFTIPCPKKKPDLTIQGYYLNARVSPSEKFIDFEVTVENIGEGTAKESTTYIYLGNPEKQTTFFLYHFPCPSLKPGGTHTYRMEHITLENCGKCEFVATADVNHEVDESNEGNNSKVIPFEIPCPEEEKPDLTIQSVLVSPSNPKEGDTVTFTVKTKNQGSENAGGFYVCYYVDGSYYDRDYVSSLSAGSTTTTSFTWAAECGNHAIKAVADCYNVIVESDEENNARTEYINIETPPKTIYVDDDFVDDPSNHKWNTVQKGINNANDGDRVIVYNGTYYENVVVNKSINLTGIDHPVVDAGRSGNVITVLADGCTVNGFKIVNSGISTLYAGIRIESGGNLLRNNEFLNNAEGVYLSHSSNNKLVGNVFSKNAHSISLYSSSTNEIENNNIRYGEYTGLILTQSSDNKIANNSILGGYNDVMDGIYLHSWKGSSHRLPKRLIT